MTAASLVTKTIASAATSSAAAGAQHGQSWPRTQWRHRRQMPAATSTTMGLQLGVQPPPIPSQPRRAPTLCLWLRVNAAGSRISRSRAAAGRRAALCALPGCFAPAFLLCGSPTSGASQAGDIYKTPQPAPSFPKQHHFLGGEHPAGPAAGHRGKTAQPEPAFWEQLPLPGLSPGHTCSDLGFPRRSPNAKLGLCTRQHLFLVRVTLETFPSAQLSEPDCIFL